MTSPDEIREQEWLEEVRRIHREIHEAQRWRRSLFSPQTIITAATVLIGIGVGYGILTVQSATMGERIAAIEHTHVRDVERLNTRVTQETGELDLDIAEERRVREVRDRELSVAVNNSFAELRNDIRDLRADLNRVFGLDRPPGQYR